MPETSAPQIERRPSDLRERLTESHRRLNAPDHQWGVEDTVRLSGQISSVLSLLAKLDGAAPAEREGREGDPILADPRTLVHCIVWNMAKALTEKYQLPGRPLTDAEWDEVTRQGVDILRQAPALPDPDGWEEIYGQARALAREQGEPEGDPRLAEAFDCGAAWERTGRRLTRDEALSIVYDRLGDDEDAEDADAPPAPGDIAEALGGMVEPDAADRAAVADMVRAKSRRVTPAPGETREDPSDYLCGVADEIQEALGVGGPEGAAVFGILERRLLDRMGAALTGEAARLAERCEFRAKGLRQMLQVEGVEPQSVTHNLLTEVAEVLDAAARILRSALAGFDPDASLASAKEGVVS